MTSDFEAVRVRVEAFELDHPDDPVPFTARLAREKGWKPAHARRVAREYLRFAALAASSPWPLSPSKAVDEVWHLHLTDSRRYWDQFCPQVLGRPLHHDPARGGPAEDARMRAQYLDTLEAYEARFGEAPPADIWPRPRVLRRFAWPATAGASLALLLTGCAALYDSSSPGAIQGPQFVIGFGLALIVGLVVTGMLQRRAAGRDRDGGVSWTALGPYDLACLFGGGRRMLETGVLKLFQAGHLTAGPSKTVPALGLPLPLDATPIEQAIWSAVERGKRLEITAITGPAISARDRLRAMGLLPDSSAWKRAWAAAILPMGLLFALGVVRLWFGHQNQRPTALLVLEMFIAAFALLMVTAASVGANPAAARLKAQARAALPRRSAKGDDDPSLPMIAAIWGLAGLGAGVSDPNMLLLYMPASSSDSGGGSSCGGGGCGGGGCGG